MAEVTCCFLYVVCGSSLCVVCCCLLLCVVRRLLLFVVAFSFVVYGLLIVVRCSCLRCLLSVVARSCCSLFVVVCGLLLCRMSRRCSLFVVRCGSLCRVGNVLFVVRLLLFAVRC